MNYVMIIGNLTADPITRTTQAGKQVVTFTVAVNRRQSAQAGHPEADFFRVAAWDKIGETCAQYLAKGRKVCVTGSVRSGAYINASGQAVGTLEVTAHEVEFLTPKQEAAQPDEREAAYLRQERNAIQNEPQQGSMLKQNAGFTEVNDEELPF